MTIVNDYISIVVISPLTISSIPHACSRPGNGRCGGEAKQSENRAAFYVVMTQASCSFLSAPPPDAHHVPLTSIHSLRSGHRVPVAFHDVK